MKGLFGLRGKRLDLKKAGGAASGAGEPPTRPQRRVRAVKPWAERGGVKREIV